jgi:hypothetical protein
MKSSVTKDGLTLPPRIWSVYHPRWGAAWCGTNVKKADLFVMTPEEFAAVYPLVLRWIRQTLADHAQSAKPVASRGFKRLPLYFSQQLLDTAKVVPVLRVPVPPLSSIGLRRFSDFEQGDWDGITYMDIIFLKRPKVANEELHFHELIHVVQWRLLGPERFLKMYADGLERFGYRDSPLERMAYSAAAQFGRSKQAFDAQSVVLRELRQLSAL